MQLVEMAYDRVGRQVLRGDRVAICSPYYAGPRTVCGIHQSETGRVTVLLTYGLSVKASDVLLTASE